MTQQLLRNLVKSRRGFSLIELLVVVAIATVLVTLLIAAIGKVRDQSRRTKAVNAINQVATAFGAYYDEYKRWPMGIAQGGGDTGPNIEATSTGIKIDRGVVSLLKGGDTAGMNPKQIRFMDFSPSDIVGGYFVDPWGNPYKYMLDYNQDRNLHVWFDGNSWDVDLKQPVAVWSTGKNGSDRLADSDDDVRNW